MCPSHSQHTIVGGLGISHTDTLVQKEENTGSTEESLVHSNPEIQWDTFIRSSSIKAQSYFCLGMTPHGFWLQPLGSWFHSLSYPSFLWKVTHVCSYVICHSASWQNLRGLKAPSHFVLSLSHLAHAGNVPDNIILLKILWVSYESNWDTNSIGQKSYPQISLR